MLAADVAVAADAAAVADSVAAVVVAGAARPGRRPAALLR